MGRLSKCLRKSRVALDRAIKTDGGRSFHYKLIDSGGGVTI